MGGKTAGFCITSCRNGLGVYQFKHADNHLKGIHEYLLRECFERFFDGVEEINYTEDLGIENLRAYKSRLAPYTLLPKLTLRARQHSVPSHTAPQERRVIFETYISLERETYSAFGA